MATNAPQFMDVDPATTPLSSSLSTPSAHSKHPLAAVRRRLVAGDLVILTAASLVAYFARSLVLPDRPFEAGAVAAASAVALVLWTASLGMVGSYDARILGFGPEEYRRVLNASLLVLALIATTSYLLALEFSRGLVLMQVPLGCALVLSHRWLQRERLKRARQTGRMLLRTLIVGESTRAETVASTFIRNPDLGYQVVGLHEPPSADLPSWLDGVDARVVHGEIEAVALTSHPRLDRIAVQALGWRLEGSGIDLLVSPDFAEVGGPRTTMRHAAGLPLIHLDEPHLSGPKRFAKRGLDLVIAVPGLALLLPLMTAIGVAIRLTSPGPALYRQTRLGQAGSPFQIVKFRTMRAGADEEESVAWADGALLGHASKNPADPRTTPLGRWLRRSSLDELPQLWNVIRGHMSLVGPRPLQPSEVVGLPGEHARRLMSRPGMTGLWQVSGRNDCDWDERMALDLQYVETWSVAGDLLLLAKTLQAVVSRRGAY